MQFLIAICSISTAVILLSWCQKYIQMHSWYIGNIYLSMYLSVCLSVFLSIAFKYVAILWGGNFIWIRAIRFLQKHKHFRKPAICQYMKQLGVRCLAQGHLSRGNTFTFSRCFYPKRLTVHSGYTFFQYVSSLGIEPTTFCATTTMFFHWATGTHIEGGERALYIHSPHRQSLPARDLNLQPFDYESDSLTIRPQLLQLFLKFTI